ncbi:MAG: hypothetical protein ACRDF4_03860 [Rhabdochlamydiaceae bacterium]
MAKRCVLKLGSARGSPAIIGGKGASLSKIVSSGLDVPKGLILTTELFDLTFDKDIIGELDKISSAKMLESGPYLASLKKRVAGLRFGKELEREIGSAVVDLFSKN